MKKTCLLLWNEQTLQMLLPSKWNSICPTPPLFNSSLIFLQSIQWKTSDVFSRSNAWSFGQELLELHPLHYLYHEGDVVYIDAYQYEIMTISEDKVSLQNVEFPILGQKLVVPTLKKS